jgi:DNA repair photolyase
MRRRRRRDATFCDASRAVTDAAAPRRAAPALASVPFPFHNRTMPAPIPSAGRLPERRRPGRGAAFDPPNRFERLARSPEPDGWDAPDDLPPLRTEVRDERARRALAWNDSPDIGFDRSLNPYRGCEHGCIYCYARPGHAHLGLSAGLDFETRLVARPNAPEALARELSRPGYRPAPLALGTMTDPYQPIERDRRLTRRILEVLRDFRHPVLVTTRGSLVERDADLLGEMAAQGLAAVGITVTTLDSDLARALEPRAPAPARRLAAIARLAAAGVPVRVMVSPVIPGLTDHELERLLAAARDAGAAGASTIVLRLPREVLPLFRDWLDRHAPGRAERVMRAVRELHGGRAYDPAFGTRMTGQGPVAALLRRRFEVACARLGLSRGLPPLRTDLFTVPPRDGQLSLF